MDILHCKYDNRDYSKYLNVKDFSDNIFTKREYKKQRAKWGFCSYDAMDIDYWFLFVMPRMIEYLKDNHIGYPMWILSEYYEKNKDILNMSEYDFYASMSNEKDEQNDNFNIDIKVLLNNVKKEDTISNSIEDCFNEQLLEDWYDFALNIESILDRKFKVKNISINKSENRLFESIDFYRKDNKGLINLSLSNANYTDNEIKENNSNNKSISINLNGKQFDSYISALKHIEELLNNLCESTTDKQKIINNTDKYCNKRWNEILDRMIFLFDECDDEKCSMKNEYISDAFKGDNDVTDKCVKRQCEIDDYQNRCKKKALKMFVKYFDNLWW